MEARCTSPRRTAKCLYNKQFWCFQTKPYPKQGAHEHHHSQKADLFLQFGSPQEGCGHSFEKLDSPLPKDAFCQSWLALRGLQLIIFESKCILTSL